MLHVPSPAFTLSWAAGKRSSFKELSWQQGRTPFPPQTLVHLLLGEEGPCASGLVLVPRGVQGTTTSFGQCCS